MNAVDVTHYIDSGLQKKFPMLHRSQVGHPMIVTGAYWLGKANLEHLRDIKRGRFDRIGQPYGLFGHALRLGWLLDGGLYGSFGLGH